jgi:alkylated DNA repair dioxygenase AlkB
LEQNTCSYRLAIVPLWQESLFDVGVAEGPRPLADELARHDLGQGAWVDVRRDWVAGHRFLFERLLDGVPWQADRRPMYDRVVDVPRLVAFYGGGSTLPDPALDRLRLDLTAYYADDCGGSLPTAGLCLYRDGRDSVAWHGDRIGRHTVQSTVVAIVSLGARRRFLLRPNSGGPALRFDVGMGDLLVMGGTCQQIWQHAVPKTTRALAPRISVQFRSPGAG